MHSAQRPLQQHECSRREREQKTFVIPLEAIGILGAYLCEELAVSIAGREIIHCADIFTFSMRRRDATLAPEPPCWRAPHGNRQPEPSASLPRTPRRASRPAAPASIIRIPSAESIFSTYKSSSAFQLRRHTKRRVLEPSLPSC